MPLLTTDAEETVTDMQLLTIDNEETVTDVPLLTTDIGIGTDMPLLTTDAEDTGTDTKRERTTTMTEAQEGFKAK